MSFLTKKFGPHLGSLKGWIAELGDELYNHKFGGSSWQVEDTIPLCGNPTLLIVLDLKDPRLQELSGVGSDELPLCSYINCDVWHSPQRFQIYPESRRILLIGRQATSFSLSDEDAFPNPLREKSLILRPMGKSESPLDENSYWEACDSFVGGKAFIRVLGPPLWMTQPEGRKCSCGKTMKYVAGIGYEQYDNPSGITNDTPFFIGEGALYFFLCPSCLIEEVISQST